MEHSGAFFPARLHSLREDNHVYTPVAFIEPKFTSAWLDLESKHPVYTERSRSPPCERPKEKTELLHVEVLLRLLDVPFDFFVDVEVKLLGHRQREEWRSLRVWFLTAVGKTQNTL